MIFILLMFTIWVGVLIFAVIDAKTTRAKLTLDDAALLLVAFVIGALIALALCGVFGAFFQHPNKSSFKTNIVKLQTSDTAVFVGVLEDEPVYFYYVQDKHKGVVLSHTWSSNTTVIEDQKPGYYYLAGFEENSHFGWFGFSVKNDDRYELHVPPGAINMSTQIDTEARDGK